MKNQLTRDSGQMGGAHCVRPAAPQRSPAGGRESRSGNHETAYLISAMRDFTHAPDALKSASAHGPSIVADGLSAAVLSSKLLKDQFAQLILCAFIQSIHL